MANFQAIRDRRGRGCHRGLNDGGPSPAEVISKFIMWPRIRNVCSFGDKPPALHKNKVCIAECH